jgi:HK97 family phage major capsid protein
MVTLSPQCILESQELLDKAAILARGGASQRLEAQALIQKSKDVRANGISSDEARAMYTRALVEKYKEPKPNNTEYRTSFDQYISGKIEEGTKEYRDFLAGTQSVSYTAGNVGGFTIPMEYDPTVRLAMAITDPLLDENVCDFTMTDGPLQPSQTSGWDLSTIIASILAESVQQLPQATPAVLGSVLRNNIVFRTAFSASQESEQDIPDFPGKVLQATGVALARAIGKSIISGKGGTDINGLCTGMGVPAVTNQTPGVLKLTDITNIYYSVNRWYRYQPKTAWLCTEPIMKMIRNMVDNQGRPLLDLQQEKEILLGKPIIECPSLASAFNISLGSVGGIVFGDLSHLVVRASRPTLQRVTQQTTSDITSGRSQWIGRMRADAAYFSPSSTFPPMVLAAIS